VTDAKIKKVDLREDLKYLYDPPAKEVVEVEVPEMRFLMVDGQGDPVTSVAYQEAGETLYALSYALKFATKEEEGVDYAVMPFEGLWWVDEEGATLEDILENRDKWKWISMIMQPEWVTERRVERALASVEKNKKCLPALRRVRFELFHEGRAAQIMHVGPHAEERPTIERVDRFIEEQGARMQGKHHEIYLTDPSRTVPKKNKTVIRHPF
jgi:hypothetical protein